MTKQPKVLERTPIRCLAVAWLIGCISIVWLSPIQAQQDLAGWVSSIASNGQQKTSVTIKYTQVDKTERLSVGDPVRNGENLVVIDPDTAVEITLLNGRRQIIRSAVPDDIELPDQKRGNLGELFGEYLGFGRNAGRRSYTFSRGDDSAITILPGLRSGESLLVAGERMIYLTWAGGKPPFKVTLTNTGETLLSLDNVFSREVSQTLSVAVGEYRLDIEGNGGAATFMFEARPASDLDSMTIPIDHDLGDTGTTIRAFELLTENEGAWGLEGYQLVYALARNRFRPAIDLVRAVQAGAFLGEDH